MKRSILTLALALVVVIMGHPMTTSAPFAQGGSMYEVVITNVTPGQTMTPFMVATHGASMNAFLPGTAASDELKTLAETGNPEPLAEKLEMYGASSNAGSAHVLTTPGVTRRVTIMAGMDHTRVTVLAMLIPTNDTFAGINAELPMYGTKTMYAFAYDAGTEVNDELCASIPGPRFSECAADSGGMGAPGNGEGAVVVSNGILGHGDFMRDRDWKNPVARITIRRMQMN